MNPIVDQLLVGGIVAGALLFFALKLRRKKKPGCDAGCGCGATKKSAVRRDG